MRNDFKELNLNLHILDSIRAIFFRNKHHLIKDCILGMLMDLSLTIFIIELDFGIELM